MLCLHEPLTVLRLKVSETQLRAVAGDKNFAIQSEDHGLVLHIDHTPNHVPLVPGTTEEMASLVYTSALRASHNKTQ